MTHVSLFTGIGGLDLAAEAAGFETILQVERDSYCLRVLHEHWPTVRRTRDVRWVRDIQRRVGARRVDVLSGGFPCQPASQAGKRRGRSDDRWLWPGMREAIRALRPRWVVAENVRGLLSLEGGMALESVLSDLECLGYETLPLVYPAAGVGAWHLRERVFIVARHAAADSERHGVRKQRERGWWQYKESREAEPEGVRGDVADSEGGAKRPGLRTREPEGQRRGRSGDSGGKDAPYSYSQGRGCSGIEEPTGIESSLGMEPDGSGEDIPDADLSGPQERGGGGPWGTRAAPFERGWWATEPGMGRVADGVSRRVDRLRALGNAVVPAQAYQVFAVIAEVEAIGARP